MRTLLVVTAAAVAFSSMAFAAEVVREPGATNGDATSYRPPRTGIVNVIVRPDGGGLEADPDIGMPALQPTGLAPAAVTGRR
jgi:hypothetical protein